jgi:hypothetical protein
MGPVMQHICDLGFKSLLRKLSTFISNKLKDCKAKLEKCDVSLSYQGLVSYYVRYTLLPQLMSVEST